ncbi:MAG: helix-turn-helix transcriptional regulator, partial [Candidatus Promineifilaceae bacterium]|nr:helix-turn-helix transcriptional regulator [Candidatus Promineifilaceae bacterium]
MHHGVLLGYNEGHKKGHSEVMETTYSFGYWVRRQRKALDLSQRELAERAACSLSAIKKIEQDKRRPSRELAEILADCLAIPEEDRENFLNSARGLAPVDALPVAGQPLSAAGSPEQPVADSPPDTTTE